jgi:predicted dehydrogenase
MYAHPPLSILAISANNDPVLDSFFAYLQSMAHVKLDLEKSTPADLSPIDVVISADTGEGDEKAEDLEQFATAGGGWLKLVHQSTQPLPEIFGAQPGQIGPKAELRVLFDDPNHPLAHRLPDAVYLEGAYHPLKTSADDSERILYADWHYGHSPVLVARQAGEGKVACTTLQDYRHPVLQQILYRLVRYLAGSRDSREILGIGILGYAPSVGKIHGLGAENTSGLKLRAACDLSTERLDRAQQDFPHIKTYAATGAFAADAGIDLVIIATPPNTHAELAVQMMAAGKHVVCEKPLALTRRETDAMVDMAEKQGVHLSCHQNRRWDVDYLAIQQALREGLIGELFYMETFVGGFHHPCGYWHSHDAVSGGLTYDWGGHYLDWVVSLIPEPILSVMSTRHKRVWHDVTNADQERIQLRFAGGQEAEFMHSDIAALRKPKWYLLGTKGAISGQWRDVVEYQPEPDVYFEEHHIPATEMPPDLTLYRRHTPGQIVTQKLAVPERRHFGFHRNIADHLLGGEPITAPLADSIRVVAILEAAARSAASGGTPEVLDG